MYNDYLDLAERLNETLPNEENKYAKIYCWVNRYDEKIHGVQICVCGKFEDVAINIKKKEMKEAVCKAYNIIRNKLGMAKYTLQIKLRHRTEPYIVA